MKAHHRYVMVCVGLVAAWYFLAYRPLAARQSRLDAHLAELYAQSAEYRRTIGGYPLELRTRQYLEHSRNELNSRLFAKQDILTLFRELEHEADSRRLRIDEITPPLDELLKLNAASAANGQPEYMSIALKMEGEYADLASYITFIEGSGFLREINSCAIREALPGQSGLRLDLSFKALLGSIKDRS